MPHSQLPHEPRALASDSDEIPLSSLPYIGHVVDKWQIEGERYYDVRVDPARTWRHDHYVLLKVAIAWACMTTLVVHWQLSLDLPVRGVLVAWIGWLAGWYVVWSLYRSCIHELS